MFNSSFEKVCGNDRDFYPKPLRTEIDQLNKTIYENVNNGVYKTGFATSQYAYTESVFKLFECLEDLEDSLGDIYLVTGSHGHIGSYIVEELCKTKDNIQIICVDIFSLFRLVAHSLFFSKWNEKKRQFSI